MKIRIIANHVRVNSVTHCYATLRMDRWRHYTGIRRNSQSNTHTHSSTDEYWREDGRATAISPPGRSYSNGARPAQRSGAVSRQKSIVQHA